MATNLHSSQQPTACSNAMLFLRAQAVFSSWGREGWWTRERASMAVEGRLRTRQSLAASGWQSSWDSREARRAATRRREGSCGGRVSSTSNSWRTMASLEVVSEAGVLRAMARSICTVLCRIFSRQGAESSLRSLQSPLTICSTSEQLSLSYCLRAVGSRLPSSSAEKSLLVSSSSALPRNWWTCSLLKGRFSNLSSRTGQPREENSLTSSALPSCRSNTNTRTRKKYFWQHRRRKRCSSLMAGLGLWLAMRTAWLSRADRLSRVPLMMSSHSLYFQLMSPSKCRCDCWIWHRRASNTLSSMVLGLGSGSLNTSQVGGSGSCCCRQLIMRGSILATLCWPMACPSSHPTHCLSTSTAPVMCRLTCWKYPSSVSFLSRPYLAPSIRPTCLWVWASSRSSRKEENWPIRRWQKQSSPSWSTKLLIRSPSFRSSRSVCWLRVGWKGGRRTTWMLLLLRNMKYLAISWLVRLASAIIVLKAVRRSSSFLKRAESTRLSTRRMQFRSSPAKVLAKLASMSFSFCSRKRPPSCWFSFTVSTTMNDTISRFRAIVSMQWKFTSSRIASLSALPGRSTIACRLVPEGGKKLGTSVTEVMSFLTFPANRGPRGLRKACLACRSQSMASCAPAAVQARVDLPARVLPMKMTPWAPEGRSSALWKRWAQSAQLPAGGFHSYSRISTS